MAEYLIQDSTLINLADKIRVLSGEEGTMTPAEMGNTVDTFNTELGEIVMEQDTLIAQLAAALNGKVAGGGGNAEPVLQSKIVNPSTSQQIITADEGYDGLDTITITPIVAIERAIPSISIDSSGLITATSLQYAGYVERGIESSTR